MFNVSNDRMYVCTFCVEHFQVLIQTLGKEGNATVYHATTRILHTLAHRWRNHVTGSANEIGYGRAVLSGSI